MKNENLFWALVISFTFGVALKWPPALKILTIGTSLLVLIDTIPQLYSTVKRSCKR